jgi:hypothetical protein
MTGQGPTGDLGFGSGWRGLIKMGSELAHMLLPGAEGLTVPITRRGEAVFRQIGAEQPFVEHLIRSRTQLPTELRQQYRQLVSDVRQAKSRGHHAVSLIHGGLFEPQVVKSLQEGYGISSRKYTAGLIRHERIHQYRIQKGIWGTQDIGVGEFPALTGVLSQIGYAPISKNIYEESIAYAAHARVVPDALKAAMGEHAPGILRELSSVKTPSVREVMTGIMSGGKIEGMADTGLAQVSRSGITGNGPTGDRGFGSGWRGIVKFPGWMIKYLGAKTGQTKMGAAEIRDPHSVIKRMFAGKTERLSPRARQEYSRVMLELAQAEEAGYRSVVAIPEYTKGLRGKIVHERVHQRFTETGAKAYIPIKSPEKMTMYRKFKTAAMKIGYGAEEIHEELVAYAHQSLYQTRHGQKPGGILGGIIPLLQDIAQANPVQAMRGTTDVGNQIRKEMIKATMKTRITETGYTAGLLGKRPHGPRGSRRMPSGGNG